MTTAIHGKAWLGNMLLPCLSVCAGFFASRLMDEARCLCALACVFLIDDHMYVSRV